MDTRQFCKTGAAALLLCATPLLAQTDLGVAEYTATGELVLPDDLDRWIVMGAGMGTEYNDEPFDPQSPPRMGIVQMEPSAYDYFLENRSYADGTMFLLTFFDTETKSQPQLQGFVQGDMWQQEIHVIDSRRFSEGRGFFLFSEPDMTSAARFPDGSVCVQCHTAEGQYDATFTQFYPAIRELIAD